MFCDAAHATDLLTRRSTTGITFFLNGAPIKWYSKRQNTIHNDCFFLILSSHTLPVVILALHRLIVFVLKAQITHYDPLTPNEIQKHPSIES